MAKVWYSWCSDWEDSTSTAITTSDSTWGQWIAYDTSATTDSTWITWTTTASTGNTVYLTPIQPAVSVPQRTATPEQQAQWDAERAEIRRKANEAMAARLEATAKARALLLSLLNEKQRAELETKKHFEIVSQQGKRYRIRQGTHGNVRTLNADGKEVGRWCGQPTGVPDEDAMLAQMLELRFNEAEFLKKSNYTAM